MATATDFEHLLIERDGTTARVTLNRPDRYNALSLDLMAELRRRSRRWAATAACARS